LGGKRERKREKKGCEISLLLNSAAWPSARRTELGEKKKKRKGGRLADQENTFSLWHDDQESKEGKRKREKNLTGEPDFNQTPKQEQQKKKEKKEKDILRDACSFIP